MAEAQEEDPIMMLSEKDLKAMIEQLKAERDLERVQTSEGCKHLLNFCEERMGEDPLVVGIPSKSNPFIEKSSCSLL